MNLFTYQDLEKDPDLQKKSLNFLPEEKPALLPIPTDLEGKLNSIDDVKIILFDIYGTLIISQSGDVGTAAGKSRAETFLRLMKIANLTPRNLETSGKIEELFFSTIKSIHEEKKKHKIPFPEVDIISVWDSTYRNIMEILESPPVLSLELMVKLSLLYESLANQTDIMPGLSSLLNKTIASGRRMGIISNAQFYTPILLEWLTGKNICKSGFDEELLIWSYKEGMGKPSQELFQMANARCLALYGVKPEEILYVGNDMRNDIFPASRAGMKTALFAGDRRSLRLREKDPLYSYIKPDIILTYLMQLTDLL
ncbi:MAG: HAD family hydrolase [Spirochaetales bacterium]|nr:HAD family hydrolase [Spirochaetales bacterium]